MVSSASETANATDSANNPCAKVMKPSDDRPDNELGSISAVDLEELNGGQRETNWKDARKMRSESTSNTDGGIRRGTNESVDREPTLEDGAD